MLIRDVWCGVIDTSNRELINLHRSPLLLHAAAHANLLSLSLSPQTAEPELRRAFLQRREAWIAGLAAELDDTHPYEFLKRLTDVYRLHLFDVVMQYRAIFSDDAREQARTGGLAAALGCCACGDASAQGGNRKFRRLAQAGRAEQRHACTWQSGRGPLPEARPEGSSPGLPMPALLFLLQAGKGPRDGGILYTWAQRRIAAYLDVRPCRAAPACLPRHQLRRPVTQLSFPKLLLRHPTCLPLAPCAQAVRTHLPRIREGGSLASVLDHAMYCGGSLGRVGLDFRPLLAPLLEQAVLALYSRVRGARGVGAGQRCPHACARRRHLPWLFLCASWRTAFPVEASTSWMGLQITAGRPVPVPVPVSSRQAPPPCCMLH